MNSSTVTRLEVSTTNIQEFTKTVRRLHLDTSRCYPHICNAVLDFRNVDHVLRNDDLGVRNVVLHVRNVVLDVRNVVLDVCNVVLDDRNVVLDFCHAALNCRRVIPHNLQDGKQHIL